MIHLLIGTIGFEWGNSKGTAETLLCHGVTETNDKIVYSVSGVSLLPTLLPLVIDIQSDVCGVNDTHKKINVHMIEMSLK